MANTYSNLFYHIVFSTKGRVDFIDQSIENRLWAYIGDAVYNLVEKITV